MLQRLRILGFSESTTIVIGDAVLYALSKAVPGLVGLFSIVIFVRLLGAEDFGRFSILGSTVLMWSAFASGWLNQGILRYNSGKSTTSHHDRIQLIKAVVFASLGCSLVTLISFKVGGTDMHWFEMLFCAVLAIFTVSQSVALAFWQSNLKPKIVLWLELLRTLGGFLLALALIWMCGSTPAALLAGTAAGYALSVAVGYRSASTGSMPPGQVDDNMQLSRLWHYGWPLSFWLGIQTAFPWFDRWLIERSLGLAETGIFASVSDVVTRSFTLLIFPLTLAVHPRITGLWNQNRQNAAFRLLGIALGIAALASVPIVAAFYWGRYALVNLLIPHNLESRITSNVTTSVGWLALGGVMWQLALLAHKPLELRKQTRVMLACMAFALLIKIVLTLLLLPKWGINGAVWGTLVSGFAYCIACLAAAARPADPASS